MWPACHELEEGKRDKFTRYMRLENKKRPYITNILSIHQPQMLHVAPFFCPHRVGFDLSWVTTSRSKHTDGKAKESDHLTGNQIYICMYMHMYIYIYVYMYIWHFLICLVQNAPFFLRLCRLCQNSRKRLLRHTADMSALWRSRSVCCVTQQTCLCVS